MSDYLIVAGRLVIWITHDLSSGPDLGGVAKRHAISDSAVYAHRTR